MHATTLAPAGGWLINSPERMHRKAELPPFALVLLLLVSQPQVPGRAEPPVTASYSRAEQFGPVKMSRHDLLQIVTHIRNFIATANGSSVEVYDESLRLAGVNHVFEVNLKSAPTAVPFERAPELIDSVRYRYLAKAGAAIRSLDLDLADFEREVQIEGAVPEQVDGLLGVVAADMKAVGAWFGGLAFRGGVTVAGVCLALILSAIMNSSGYRISAQMRLAVIIASLLAVIVLFTAPWEGWFPGTAVYSESASWFVRNNSLIGASGVVLTVLCFLGGIAHSAYLSRTKK